MRFMGYGIMEAVLLIRKVMNWTEEDTGILGYLGFGGGEVTETRGRAPCGGF
jgi:hypothetical protein